MSSSQDDAPSPGRRGRRPGQSETRQAILDTARARFAADGFTATTIRRIAADAGVDAALVMQFFKSKDELFGAVMSVPPAALARMTDSWQGPRTASGSASRARARSSPSGRTIRRRPSPCWRCSAVRSPRSRRPRSCATSSTPG